MKRIALLALLAIAAVCRATGLMLPGASTRPASVSAATPAVIRTQPLWPASLLYEQNTARFVSEMSPAADPAVTLAQSKANLGTVPPAR